MISRLNPLVGILDLHTLCPQRQNFPFYRMEQPFWHQLGKPGIILCLVCSAICVEMHPRGRIKMPVTIVSSSAFDKPIVIQGRAEGFEFSAMPGAYPPSMEILLFPKCITKG